MHDFLAELLQCPVCHGILEWHNIERRREQIEEAEAHCTVCGIVYPVHHGIGFFLTTNLPRQDYWEQSSSGISQYFTEHPEVERELMAVPLESLHPADQFLRSLVLEDRGQYAEARAIAELAIPALYTPEYRTGWQSQMDYVLERLARVEGPIVDLASGRCYLAEKMAQQLSQPVVVTDFSPRVLRRDQEQFQLWGLDDRISLLALDARRTPFKDGAVQTMTSNLGLVNIEQPGSLWEELRRIVRGILLSVSHFYPEKDSQNGAAIRDLGLGDLLFERPALLRFVEAGWQVEIVNCYEGRALPTPPGTIMDGRIDGLPITETVLKWCVLVAS